jgi:hypothetical protein
MNCSQHYAIQKLAVSDVSDIFELNMGRILENGGAEDFVVQFAVDIWNQAGNCMDFNSPFEEKVNLTVALMY